LCEDARVPYDVPRILTPEHWCRVKESLWVWQSEAQSFLSQRERAGGEGLRGHGPKPLTLTLSQREKGNMVKKVV